MPVSNRRTFIVSAGVAAAAFGINKQLGFLPSARADELRDKGYFKFKVGDIEVTTLYDGHWDKPHDPGFIRNASVAETKAALKAAGRSDDKVQIPFTVTFVKTPGRTIMFDAGTGGQMAPTAGRLSANMKAAGISPAEIGTIIITHFHPDHIFGLMEKDTNAQVYPNAEIIVPDPEFAFWTDKTRTATLGKYRQGLAKRVRATLPNWSNVSRFSGEKEVAPGITAIPAHGHTAGHTVFSVASGSDQLLVMADTSNIPALFVRNPGWHAVFDADPDAAEASRRRVFDRAISDKAIVTGYHFGMPGAGRIEKDGTGYAFVPLA
jgi:glyoxylase-like metal-dependent hydrolase (beta-lactamase superfamily II)